MRTFNNEKDIIAWSALHALRAFQGWLRGLSACGFPILPTRTKVRGYPATVESLFQIHNSQSEIRNKIKKARILFRAYFKRPHGDSNPSYKIENLES
jgi:hypothetical protein